MEAILIAFLNSQAGQDLAAVVITTFVAAAARWAEKKLLANKRTAALAVLPEIAAAAVDDGVKAATNAPANQRLQLSIAAARADLVANYPSIAKAFTGEVLTALVAGHVAMETISPGGMTVNLPTPIPVGGKP